MCYEQKDGDFEHHRNLYLACLLQKKFPWTPAYYYYMQNIDRIDVMSFADFQDDLLTISSMQGNIEEEFENVSSHIYQALDQYYMVQQLLTKDNQPIKLL